MCFNKFALSTEPIDMTTTEEFGSLLESARDLGISYQSPIRYEARNVVVNGHRLHMLEWGNEKAPLMILLHGGNQQGHSWDMVSLNLCQHFHIIAVDQRGHGDSEWPRDGDMSLAALGADVLDLLAKVVPVQSRS